MNNFYEDGRGVPIAKRNPRFIMTKHHKQHRVTPSKGKELPVDTRYITLLHNAKEITEEDYDPKMKIRGFWEKYGANNSRLHVLNLFLFYKGETVLQEQLSIEEMKQFSQDLMTLLMAYYVAHREKINLDDIKIPVEETREENGEEGSFSDIPYTILGLHYLEQKLNR